MMNCESIPTTQVEKSEETTTSRTLSAFIFWSAVDRVASAPLLHRCHASLRHARFPSPEPVMSCISYDQLIAYVPAMIASAENADLTIKIHVVFLCSSSVLSNLLSNVPAGAATCSRRAPASPAGGGEGGRRERCPLILVYVRRGGGEERKGNKHFCHTFLPHEAAPSLAASSAGRKCAIRRRKVVNVILRLAGGDGNCNARSLAQSAKKEKQKETAV